MSQKKKKISDPGPQVGEWVATSDASPMKGAHVLGCLGCGTRLVMCFDDPRYGEGWRDVEGYSEYPVYWTPLPEVPRDLR